MTESSARASQPTTGRPRPLDAYVAAAALEEPKAALFQSVDPAGRRLTGRALERRVVAASSASGPVTLYRYVGPHGELREHLRTGGVLAAAANAKLRSQLAGSGARPACRKTDPELRGDSRELPSHGDPAGTSGKRSGFR